MKEILEVHNRFRAKIARGEERRGSPGPQPPAANMKIMVSLSCSACRGGLPARFPGDCCISHIGGDDIGGVRTIAVISVWCMMCVVFGVWSLTGLSSQQIFLSEIFCRVIL